MRRLIGLIPFFLIALLVGVFIASLWTPPSWFTGSLVLLTVGTLGFFILRKQERFALTTLLLLGLLCGITRYEIWEHQATDQFLMSNTGEKLTLEGIISDEPDVRENVTQITVDVTEVREASSTRAVFGTALIVTSRYPEYHYGDRIAIVGKLTEPEPLTSLDGRVFDYPAFLRAKGIRYQIAFPNISLLAHDRGNWLLDKLFFMKARFEAAIAVAEPHPESALLSGLLLGGKQSLGKEWIDRFRVAGIVHIIVLSGYNMTVVAEWLVVLFRFLGFYGSLSAGSVGIVLFALMTGGGATVLRAAIMALLVLLSKATGRSYDMGRALLLAATLMVLENPSILLDDPSFQLSFLASLGLIVISPIIERRLTLWRTLTIWREIFISTLATQTLVLPLLLYQTGIFSLVALPVNLIILPIIPLTMLLGFAGGMLALLLPSIGFIVGIPAHILLSYILGVARFAALLPYAALQTGSIPAFVVAALYIVILAVVYREQRIIRSRAHHPSRAV